MCSCMTCSCSLLIEMRSAVAMVPTMAAQLAAKMVGKLEDLSAVSRVELKAVLLVAMMADLLVL